MATKTPEQIEADAEAAKKAEREELARQSNQKRNDARIERLNAIADNSDELKEEEDELEPLTDEVWDQGDRPEDARRRTRADRIAEQDADEDEVELGDDGKPLTEDEAAARLLRRSEKADREADAARGAGADDVRRKGGVTQYRVNGKWLTLAEVRALGGDPEEGDEGLQGEEDGATSPSDRRTSQTPAEREAARVIAEEQEKADRKLRKDKLRDLYTRASMGDEQAIDELADMQADGSRVTPDLQRMVNEQVDARITGRTEFQQAVDWFESEAGYADVLTTPALKAEAARVDSEMARAHPDWTPKQRLNATGKKMRELRAAFGGTAAPTPKTPTNDKLRRKAAIRQVPTASGRARVEDEPDERESTHDAIKAMAQGRGQRRAIEH